MNTFGIGCGLNVSITFGILSISTVFYKWAIDEDFLLDSLLLNEFISISCMLEDRVWFFWFNQGVVDLDTAAVSIGAHLIIAIRSCRRKSNTAKCSPIVASTWKVTTIGILVYPICSICWIVLSLWRSWPVWVKSIILSYHRMRELTLPFLNRFKG